MHITILTLFISVHTLYKYTQYPNKRDTHQISEFDPNVKKLSLLDKLKMYEDLLEKNKDECNCEKQKKHTKADDNRPKQKEEAKDKDKPQEEEEEAEVKEEEAVSECNCDEDNDYLNELEAERKKKNAVLKAKQLEDRKKVEKNVIPSIKAESAINDKLMRDAYERRLRDYERAFV
ncbi:hypothetical protein LUQ84_002219 [Hamiltosporidium tvaerminnensis]|nr:hypothetical protein LUQ84_002219 [Hamiltosporidium tvaerminnensis]